MRQSGECCVCCADGSADSPRALRAFRPLRLARGRPRESEIKGEECMFLSHFCAGLTLSSSQSTARPRVHVARGLSGAQDAGAMTLGALRWWRDARCRVAPRQSLGPRDGNIPSRDVVREPNRRRGYTSRGEDGRARPPEPMHSAARRTTLDARVQTTSRCAARGKPRSRSGVGAAPRVRRLRRQRRHHLSSPPVGLRRLEPR